MVKRIEPRNYGLQVFSIHCPSQCDGVNIRLQSSMLRSASERLYLSVSFPVLASSVNTSSVCEFVRN